MELGIYLLDIFKSVVIVSISGHHTTTPALTGTALDIHPHVSQKSYFEVFKVKFRNSILKVRHLTLNGEGKGQGLG